MHPPCRVRTPRRSARRYNGRGIRTRAAACGLAENPLVLAEDRHCGTASIDSVHVDLRPADRDVRVDGRLVATLAPLERILVRGSVGDVGGDVLVEERVVERHAQLTDPRSAVDER